MITEDLDTLTQHFEETFQECSTKAAGSGLEKAELNIPTTSSILTLSLLPIVVK